MSKEKNEIAVEILKKWESHKDLSLVYKLCNESKNGRIHHLLFRDMVFPVIKDGILNNIELDVIAGVNCIQNIYNDKRLWEQIGYVSEFYMLQRLIKSGSKNEWVINKFIDTAVSWLRYCIHEWPSGVLYGANGANISECNEILQLIEELRAYDIKNDVRDILTDVETKTKLYLNSI